MHGIDYVILNLKCSIMKIRNYFLGMVLLCVTMSFTSFAATENKKNNKVAIKERAALMSKAQKDARITEIKARVSEIKAMDKSKLSRSENKALRHELKAISREAHHLGSRDVAIAMLGGVLVSVLLLLALA